MLRLPLPHANRHLLSLALLGTLPALMHAQGNRFSLSEEKPSPRFEITPPQWPQKVGEASVSLWHDDKIAALSITIDDNCAPDIPWWRKMADAHNFRATWFVITGRISGSNSFNGTWQDFQGLRDAGHAVESHTVEHLHANRGPEDGSYSIEWEYGESLRQIDNNLKGPRTSALAYPGGPNKALNKRAAATPLYRSARGGSGTPNQASRIDYLNINGMSSFHFGSGKGEWSNLNSLFDPSLHRGRNYRGWAVVLAHKINDNNRARWEELFAFIDTNQDTLWVGLFTDVAKYGQERDTATLTVTENTANSIRFDLTDEMDDTYFDFPLTVKVRIPDAWPAAAVTATQAGKATGVRTLSHEGGSYALVQAIPDRGTVRLAPHPQ